MYSTWNLRIVSSYHKFYGSIPLLKASIIYWLVIVDDLETDEFFLEKSLINMKFIMN